MRRSLLHFFSLNLLTITLQGRCTVHGIKYMWIRVYYSTVAMLQIEKKGRSDENDVQSIVFMTKVNRIIWKIFFDFFLCLIFFCLLFIENNQRLKGFQWPFFFLFSIDVDFYFPKIKLTSKSMYMIFFVCKKICFSAPMWKILTV